MLEGFRMTEIGPLPEKWEVVSLGSIVNVYDSQRIPLRSEDRQRMRGTFPYCGANGIIDHIDRYLFDGEFLLLAEDGGYWDRFKESSYVMDGKFWVNNHAHVLAAMNGRAVNHYLMYMLNYLDISTFIGGTTRGKLTQGVMRSIPIPLPQLSEQTAIAGVLSTLQKAIDAQDKVLAAATEVKKSLMRHLFTYGPVPIAEAEKVPRRETEIGSVPIGWEVAELGDTCAIVTGKKDVDQGNPDGLYPFFSCAQRMHRSDTYSFDCEAILIAGNGDVGSVKYYDGQFEAYQRTYVLHDFKQFTKYLYFFLDCNIKKELVLRRSGSAMPYIRKGDLANFVLPLPPLPEQKVIATVLSTVQKAIQAEEVHKASLQSLFKTMLHHLMSGRLRVKDLEVTAE